MLPRLTAHENGHVSHICTTCTFIVFDNSLTDESCQFHSSVCKQEEGTFVTHIQLNRECYWNVFTVVY